MSIADYPAALRRIVDGDIPDDATTEDEILEALQSSEAPQITPQNARDAVDAITTYEDVVAAIENSGETPRADEIDSVAQALDQYDLDLTDAVVDDVSGDIATREDFENAVQNADPTFREDVSDAVDGVASSKDVVGGSADDIVDDLARQASAPTKADFQRSVAQSVAQSDSVNPSEAFDDVSRETEVSVIRNSSGDAVAVAGGANASDRQRVADMVGAETVYDDPTEVTSDVSPQAEGGGRASLRLRGEEIGEVQV